MVNEERFFTHRLANLIHTGLILAALFGLTGFLGWMLWGTSGLLWSLIGAALLVMLTPSLSPAAILRLYRARPLSPAQAPNLYHIVQELARRAKLPSTPTLFVVPTPVMNAFAVGTDRQYAVALTNGLLRTMDLRELTGILAHELSHIRHNDLRVMTLADTASRITSIFSTLGQILLVINLPLILSGVGRIPFIPILILIFAPTLTALLQLALSRSREFDADLEAARLTGDPMGLAQALMKMEYSRGSFFDRIFLPGRREPDPSILRTHPNTEERIERLKDLAGSGEFETTPHPRVTPPGREIFPHNAFPRPGRPRWRIGGFWY